MYRNNSISETVTPYLTAMEKTCQIPSLSFAFSASVFFSFSVLFVTLY